MTGISGSADAPGDTVLIANIASRQHPESAMPRSTDSNPAPYGRVAIALHWLIALLLLAQITLGWWMLGVPKSPPGVRAGWFNLHKSIGSSLGLLILARIAWRLTHKPPALAMLPKWHGEWPAGKAFMSDVHAATAWTFAVLLGVHIAAALWHAGRRDGIFLRMWPGTRRLTRWQSDSGWTRSRGAA